MTATPTAPETAAGASRRPHRRLRRVGATAGLLLLGLAVLTWLTRDPSPVGHFRTPGGQAAYTAAYERAMAVLPPAAETWDLSTSFGTVRVYRFGPAPDPSVVPVLLLPGRTSGVPMWELNLPDFAEARTTYALDALGDAGLSVQTRRLTDGADQAAWLDQVVNQLPAPRVHLVGHSFGGWLGANYAIRHPERVQSLTLLEPVMVLVGLRWSIYLKSIPASLPFLPQRWRDAMLSDFGGTEGIDPEDPMTAMITAASEHYAVKVPAPELPHPNELAGLTMPVYVGLGGRSVMHDSAAAAAVARQQVPDATVRMWPEASHSLPMEHPAAVDRELMDFWAAHDG